MNDQPEKKKKTKKKQKPTFESFVPHLSIYQLFSYLKISKKKTLFATF